MISDNYLPTKTLGNGSTVIFTFNWDAISSTALKVYFQDASTGLITEQTVGFTKTLNSGAGGQVEFSTAPTSAYYVILARTTERSQTDPYETSSGFQAGVVENNFDKLVAMIQEDTDKLSRSFTYPIGTDVDGLGYSTEVPLPEAGTVLGWNEDEDALVNLTPNTGAYLIKASQAEAEAGANDTAYMTPLRSAQAIAALAVTVSSVSTLTNKRITPRVGSTTSSATPTINTDSYDAYSITALAAAITSMTTNLSGTPTNFQKLQIRIKDDGTARAITWGASFQDGSVALPTTTVLGKVLNVGLIYDSVDAKWTCEASGSRA